MGFDSLGVEFYEDPLNNAQKAPFLDCRAPFWCTVVAPSPHPRTRSSISLQRHKVHSSDAEPLIPRNKIAPGKENPRQRGGFSCGSLGWLVSPGGECYLIHPAGRRRTDDEHVPQILNPDAAPAIPCSQSLDCSYHAAPGLGTSPPPLDPAVVRLPTERISHLDVVHVNLQLEHQHALATPVYRWDYPCL